jgi:hypothetical protein
MLEKLTSPTAYPEDAAQELLALLTEAGAFTPKSAALTGTACGQSTAEAMIATHKALTAYYKTLEQ